MKKYIVLIAALVLFASCEKEEKWTAPTLDVQKSTFTDTRDGIEYECITINGQTWMAENLKYRLPMGPLDGCLTYDEEFDSTKLMAKLKLKVSIDKKVFSDRVKVLCPQAYKFPPNLLSNFWYLGIHDEFCNARGSYYTKNYALFESGVVYSAMMDIVNKDSTTLKPLSDFVALLRQANKEQEDALAIKAIIGEADQNYLRDNGYLYTYKNIEKVIPEGWRLPTDEDWQKLEQSLGVPVDQLGNIEQWRGDQNGSLLKKGELGSGFDAEYPGCYIYGQPLGSNKYRNRDFKAYYWTSTVLMKDNRECAIIRALQYNQEGVYRGTSPTIQAAYSIRCIKK